MGKKSREKWERRMAAALGDASKIIEEAKLPHETPISLRAWLRSCGVAGILLGGVGLMSTLFWPSIFSFYVGLALLSVDVFLEKFRWSLLRYFVLAVIVLLGVALTKYVVLHDDPITEEFYGYSASAEEQGQVEVWIENGTEVDYTNVDFHIVLPKEKYVVAAKQIGSLASCSLFPVVQGNAVEGEQIILSTNPANPNPRGNYQRVRCEVLPHQSVLHVSLTVREGKVLGTPSGKLDELYIKGEYKGKFRSFQMPSRPTYLTSWGRGWSPQ